MPWVVVKHNGKTERLPFLFTEAEVGNLERRLREGESFTLVNTTTRRQKTIKRAKPKAKRKR